MRIGRNPRSAKPRTKRLSSSSTACPIRRSGRASRCKPQPGRCGARCSRLRVGKPLLEIQLRAVAERRGKSFPARRRPAQEHAETDGRFLCNRCRREELRGAPKWRRVQAGRQRPDDFQRIEDSNLRSRDLPGEQEKPPRFRGERNRKKAGDACPGAD